MYAGQSPREPLIGIAIEPRSAADRERLELALRELTKHDPSLRTSIDKESGQIVLQGTDEVHLETKIDLLRRSYHVDAKVGAPQVAYRECLDRGTEIDYTHRSQTDRPRQFARVKIKFDPGEPGSGFVFESRIKGAALPNEFIAAVERSLESARDGGLVAGFPVLDLRATLLDGAYHDLDSSVTAFEIAARAAFRELRHTGAPQLLEPIMKVEVVAPDDYLGDVVADLNSRRGQITGIDQRGNGHAIDAMVPLANMLGYSGALRRIRRGHGQFTMQFDHYEVVPPKPSPDSFPPAIGMRA